MKTVTGIYSATVEQRKQYETRQFEPFKRSHKHNFEHRLRRQGQLYGLTCVRIDNCFLGAFAKLRKATISFVMSVRPSHETTRLLLDGFS